MKRHFTSSAGRPMLSKSIFAARASAKEGAWVAYNAPSSLPPSVAVRLTPAVQLLEAEHQLVNKSPDSPSPSTSSAAASAGSVGGAPAQHQRRRLQQRSHFAYSPRNAAYAAATTTMRDIARSVERANINANTNAGGRGSRGSEESWIDSAGGSVLAFFALLSLPVVFSMGRQYEISQTKTRESSQLDEMDELFIQRTASKLALKKEGLGQTDGLLMLGAQKDGDGAVGTVLQLVDKGVSTVATQAAPTRQDEGKLTRGKGAGWFWSSNTDH